MRDSAAARSLPVREPYRLDLTATVLRRLSTNVVDVFADGTYRRLIGDPLHPALLSVTQPAPDHLAVSVAGEADGVDPAALVSRMLGADVDLTPFTTAASSIGWLAPLVATMRGVKSPRYPSLWEALVNAVVYQQVSIHAAGAILRRVIEHVVPPRLVDGVELAPFPTPEMLLSIDRDVLRSLGLSRNKVVALHGLALALIDGTLDEATLARLPTPALCDALVAHRGIGPWTAAVIALRGFGRLDIFPLNDSGVAKSLRDLSGGIDVDADALLAMLGRQRGMLYYHLLLGRLAARGDISPR